MKYNPEDKCGLCSRELGDGMVDFHHLIPKTRKGKVTVPIHKICHRKIHSVFTEKELEKKYFTFEALLRDSDIQTFVEWVKNKPLAFYVKGSDAKRKK